MAHHAPLPEQVGTLVDREQAPGASMRTRPPAAVAHARDELFHDADRHGPRAGTLVRRAAPVVAFTPIALWAATWEPLRRAAIEAVEPRGADLLLVAPMLLALALLGAALAPLARTRVAPLLGAGIALWASGVWLVLQGQLAWASVPTAVGATLVGVAAARVVRRAVWALPLLAAAGASDAHSVAVGVTGRLLDGTDAGAREASIDAVTRVAPELVQRIDLLVLHVPAATGTWLLGAIDVVAIGMLLGLAHLFWLPLGRTAAAVVLALATAVALGGAVPVLPLLGATWLAVHARLVWRATRFSLRRLTYLGG